MSTTWIFWCRHYKTQSFEQITFTLVCIISLLTFCAWWKSQSLFPDHDKKFAWRSSSVGRAAFQRSQSGATISTDVSSNPVRDHLLLRRGMGVWNKPSRSIWLQLRYEIAQFRKAEGKNPENGISFVRPHFHQNRWFPDFPQFSRKSFWATDQNFFFLQQKTFVAEPTFVFSDATKKRLWITIRPKWSQADILTRRRRQQWQQKKMLFLYLLGKQRLSKEPAGQD